jgi:hypothetical protein
LFYIGFNLSPILSPINNYFTLWYTYLLTLYFIALNGLKIAHHFDGGKFTPIRFALRRFASLRIASLRIWWKVYTHFGRVKYGKTTRKSVSSATQKRKANLSKTLCPQQRTSRDPIWKCSIFVVPLYCSIKAWQDVTN